MAFNLYAAGAHSKKTFDYFAARPERLRLLSYYRERLHIERRCALGLKTFVDSGAFSAHTKDAILNVDEYIEWLNKYDDGVSIFAQVDKIPGKFRMPKSKQDLEEAPEESWQNYLYMRERVKSPEKLLPIFHQGEDFCHLQRMLDFEPKIQYIGISPSNDVHTEGKERWIERCFEVIKASKNPEVKTHAFGMTALYLLEKYPFYSADSTSWLMIGVHGNIMTPWGIQTVSGVRTKEFDHIQHMPENKKQVLKEYIEKMGYTIEQLAESYQARCDFNLDYLNEWAVNFKPYYAKVKQNSLF